MNRFVIQINLNKDYISTIMLLLLCIPTIALDERSKSLLYSIWVICFCWSLLTFWAYQIYRERRLYPIWGLILITIISAVLNPTNISANIKLIVLLFCATVLTYNMIQHGWMTAIESIGIIYTFFTIMQLISALTHFLGYSTDVYDNRYMYFFGIRVNYTGFYIFSVAIALLLLVYGRFIYKIAGIAMIGIGTWFVIYESVSTCEVAAIVLIVSIFCMHINFNEKLWRNIIILSAVVVMYFIINYRKFAIFSYIFVNILGKDVMVHGRTELWQQGIDRMSGWHWIFGNGYKNVNGLYHFSSSTGGRYVDVIHNQYLAYLVDFGLIGLGLFLIVLVFVIMEVIKSNETIYRAKRIVMGVVLAIIVMGIPAQYFQYPYFYIFVVISLYMELFEVELLRDDRIIEASVANGDSLIS